jgi:hypothetical protein
VRLNFGIGEVGRLGGSTGCPPGDALFGPSAPTEAGSGISSCKDFGGDRGDSTRKDGGDRGGGNVL